MKNKGINEQVYERYLDATAALFLEHYSAALADSAEKELVSKNSTAELDRRCMALISKKCAALRHKAIWKGTKKVLRSAAMILIAILSLSSVLFVTVEAYRVPVINFFIEQGDGFWVITGEEEDIPVDVVFDPDDPLAGAVPDGYVLNKVSGDASRVLRAVYTHENGGKIRLTIAHSANITVDSENATASRECTVAGHAGVYVCKKGESQLAWVDAERNTSYLLLSDVLSEGELITIAEKMMNLFHE